MMKSARLILTASATCLPLIVGAAQATDTTVGQLVKVKGSAVISQGALYSLGQEGTPLQPGNRLMTLEGGEAVLQFADQCLYRLGEDQLFDIGAQSPCALGQGGEYPAGEQLAVMAGDQTPALQPAALGDGKASKKGAADLTAIGTLTEVTGSVQINGKPTRAGAPLQRNNPLQTGPDGEATLTFTDGQTLHLRSASRFSIKDYRYAAQQPERNRAIFDLAQGSLIYQAGTMAKDNPQAVKLITPSGTLDVNAANFTVIIGSMVLQVSAGSVTLNGQEITAGQYVYVSDLGNLQIFNSLAELEAAIPQELLAQASTLQSTTAIAAGQTATLTGGLSTAALSAGVLGATLVGVAINEATKQNDPISVEP